MRFLFGQLVVCFLGIAESQRTVLKSDDGFIGCYQYPIKVYTTRLPHNNGHKCKELCFSKLYRYAGTQVDRCYCASYIKGTKVSDTMCNLDCPDIHGATRKCGGPFRMTMYDRNAILNATTKVHVTSETTTPIPTSSGLMNQSVSTNDTEWVPTISTRNKWIWYILVPAAFVVIKTIVGFTLVCLYRSRHNRTAQRTTSQDIQTNLYDGPDEPSNMNRGTIDVPANSLQNGSDETASLYDDTACGCRPQLSTKSKS